MIERYSLPEIAGLWTSQARYANWLEVELLALAGLAKAGVVSDAIVEHARQNAPVVDAEFVSRCMAREEITNHDVAAFVDVVQESIGGESGPFIHYGLTSTDVVDTALCRTLASAVGLLIAAATDLVETSRSLAEAHRNTPMMGRTHGVHAEPTTFGNKLALWCLQLDRDRTRLLRALQAISVGKLSGAVGTYSNIDPIVEAYVCEQLELTPVPATQVISRDRHNEVLFACASVATTIEMIATEIRHLARTEVGEVAEAFAAGNKGSSAMPHKRNPILSERLCGLARVVRGYSNAASDNVALWHERDISHSSAERIILPDATILTYYMLVKANSLLKGLVVNAERMRANIDRSYGLYASQTVLSHLVAAGMTRDDAYRVVQSCATQAFEQQLPFVDVLSADAQVTERLSQQELAACFDLDALLVNASKTVDALSQVEGPQTWK